MVAQPARVTRITDGTDFVAIDGSGNMNVIESNSAAIKTAVETIDNFISGSRGLVTEDNSAAIKTAVELVDDTVATDGSAAVTKLLQVGGTDGTNAQILAMETDGRAKISDGGGSITIDGSVSVTGSVDTELPAAAALADNAANPTAPAVGAFGMVWDGSTWDRMPGTSADGVTVNLGTNNDVTVTGNVTVVQSTATNLKTQAELYVGGTAVSSTAPVPVYILDGTSAVSPKAAFVQTTALASAGTETENATAITNAKTGKLNKVTVSSQAAGTAEVQKYDGTTGTTLGYVVVPAGGGTVVFEPKNSDSTLYAQAGDGSTKFFRILFTNTEPTVETGTYTYQATVEWDES